MNRKQIEEKIEKIRSEKNAAVSNKDYETACKLRSKEVLLKNLIEDELFAVAEKKASKKAKIRLEDTNEYKECLVKNGVSLD